MKTIFAPFQQKRLRICGILAAGAMAAGSLSAQSPAPRIRTEISSSATSIIKGSLHPLAQPQNDAGRMPADTRLTGISIYFNRSAAQQADLEALLAAQQNPILSAVSPVADARPVRCPLWHGAVGYRRRSRPGCSGRDSRLIRWPAAAT